MKILALVSAVLAALVWLAYGTLVTDLLGPFLANWQANGGDLTLGKFAWYAVPAVSAIGGITALVSGGVGGLLLLVAAGGWFALGSLAPQGLELSSILPLALAGAAALFAFLSARTPGPVRMARAPTLDDLAREDALRADPTRFEPRMKRAAPSLMPAREAAPLLVPDRDMAPAPTQVAAHAPAYAPAHAPRQSTYPVPAASGAGGSATGLLVANGLLSLVLVAIVGLLLYRDYGLEGRPLPWSGQRAAVVDAGAAARAPLPARAAESPAMPPVPVATGSIPPATMLANAGIADPFRYCAQVDTIDAPDGRYSGPRFTKPIADAVRAPMSSSADRVKWRCVDGAVWACSSFDWPVCALTPSVGEMLEFCATNPGAKGLQAPNGNWGCEGNRPVIPPGENWPVDARGFLPNAWVRVLPPAA